MKPFNRIKTLFVGLFCMTLLLGCGKTEGSQAQSGESGDVQLFAAGPDVFAGSHILIAYAGAMRADSAVVRTKEEALALATDLVKQLTADPSKFEDLARENSDGPSGPEGGDLGTWNKGQMVPEFDAAIETMELGAVGSEPVETAFGYHVMRRNDTRAAHYGAEGFIIGVAGLRGVPPEVTRDSAAAAALVEEIKGKITGDNFDEMAMEHNDFAEEKMFIGAFKEGDPVTPEIMELIKSLGYDEVGGPLELPVGHAFMKRIKLEQRAGAHILVAYSGAMRADPSITRTKEEAKAEADRILALAKASPDKFAELAAEHSDGPSGPQGGDLGVWFRGSMVPEFDKALDTMNGGDIANEPVETDFGYHIIMRSEVDL
ncbi:MAG: peptidylprolyl isomerase [Rhodothermales bacterium]